MAVVVDTQTEKLYTCRVEILLSVDVERITDLGPLIP